METETLIKQANQAYQQKKYIEAGQFFQQAAALFQQQEKPVDQAEMLNSASVAYLQAGNAQTAYDLVEGTDQTFKALNLIDKQGIALANQAAALDELGKTQEALQIFQEASDLLKQAGLKDHRAHVLKRISALQIKSGRQFEALGSMHSALENAEKLSGREKTLKRLTNWVMKMIQRG